jgi:hypothetical protein
MSRHFMKHGAYACRTLFAPPPIVPNQVPQEGS